MAITALTPKPKPILVIREDLQEMIDTHAWGLRDLLVAYKIPTPQWNNIWKNLEAENSVFKEMDEDLDVQWIVGWFQGIANALDTDEQSLVSL